MNFSSLVPESLPISWEHHANERLGQNAMIYGVAALYSLGEEANRVPK